MPTVDGRPGRLDAIFRPGDDFTVTLTGPAGWLSTRDFTATLGGVALSVSESTDDLVIVASAAITTAASTATQAFVLTETGGNDALVGKWTPRTDGSLHTNLTADVIVDTVDATVTILGGAAGVTWPLDHTGATAATDAVTLDVTGDTNDRLVIDHDGTLRWGSGAAASDAALRRSDVGVLSIDGAAVGFRVVEGTWAGAGHYASTRATAFDSAITVERWDGGANYRNAYLSVSDGADSYMALDDLEIKSDTTKFYTAYEFKALILTASGFTGSTEDVRIVGGTLSGAPVAGAHSVGDIAIAVNGHVFVCTVAGTPGTWVEAGTGAFQPADSDLTAIAALAPANDDIIQRKAGAWTNRTTAQLLTDLNLGAVYQPLDADLTDIAAIADAQGDIIVRGAAGWERLAKSATATDVLVAGASQPAWAAAASPAMVVLAETVVAGSAVASITFSSIPATYRHLMIEFAGATSDAAIQVLRLRFNSDATASIYTSQLHAAFGATIDRDSETTTSMRIGFAAKDGDASYQSSAVIQIPNYANSSFYKTASSAFTDSQSTGPTVKAGVFSGAWRSAAAITSVTLFATAGNLKIGTVATLYGLKTA